MVLSVVDFYFAISPKESKENTSLKKTMPLLFNPETKRGLKLIWFFLVAILFGPFSLWFMLFAKKNRRNLEKNYLTVLGLLLGLSVGFYAFLFIAPVHWIKLLILYFFSGLVSSIFILRHSHSHLLGLWILNSLQTPTHGDREEPRFTYKQTLMAVGLAIYPIVYIISLFHSIMDLQNFSIHLPSEVYTDGLLWMVYATPGIMLLAWLGLWYKINPSLRSLVYFYASLLVILVWLVIWEKADSILLATLYSQDREPLFFQLRLEENFRFTVKLFFYASAFLLGSGYLVTSVRSQIFFRRTLFLGLPSLLLYANMLFVMGDWNFYLIGIKEKAFLNQNIDLYRIMVRSQLKRIPAAYRTPETISEWAEYEYQLGNISKAKELFTKISKETPAKPFYTHLKRMAEQSLNNLSSKTISNSHLTAFASIKPASYLNQDWYGLLSTVAFLKPQWSDLDLKKKLLELSSSVQINLPKLNNIPDLIPVLREFEIPATTCFLSVERIKTALKAGHIPYLNLYGHWVPITGYDGGRHGYYYFVYRKRSQLNWFSNNDLDLISPRTEKVLAKDSARVQSVITSKVAADFILQNFIPEQELQDHITDLGGVGLILGDSLFVSKREKEAAYLVELGDAHYQEHDNYPEAATNYHEAELLFKNDQIESRILYLKRRYSEFASDAGDFENLFHEYPPKWMKLLGPDSSKEKEIVTKIINGKLGTYLMMNWITRSESDSNAKAKIKLDTAIQLYTWLHQKDSEEPIYLDSLAHIYFRQGNLDKSESFLNELSQLYPFGNENVSYRQAWIKLKLGKISEVAPLLSECKTFSNEARYLTLKAAVALNKGKGKTAFSLLERSLKLDKSLSETHELLVKYYQSRHDKSNAQLYELWQRRSS